MKYYVLAISLAKRSESYEMVFMSNSKSKWQRETSIGGWNICFEACTESNESGNESPWLCYKNTVKRICRYNFLFIY